MLPPPMRMQADIVYAMLWLQRRQSTADPPTKSKITDPFQRNTPETNDGVVELVCRADPGSSEVELHDAELSSLIGVRTCWKQGGTGSSRY